MFQQLFKNITNTEKVEAIKNVITHSTPSADFFLMIFLSVLMATLGLLANSSAVIVGSMLIAPVLYPILSLSMGIVMSDFLVTGKAMVTLIKSFFLGVFASVFTSLLFASYNGVPYTTETLARAEPSLLYVAIGAVAGLAAAFTMVKSRLSGALPGVAISVALIPPVSVIGIGIAHLDIQIIFQSFLFLIINTAGVIFTSMIVFAFMNFYAKKEVADKTVKQEEKILEHEKEKSKSIKS